MFRTTLRKFWLPAGACFVSGAFAIVGGACVYSSPPPVPTLHTGRYVLTSVNGQTPPQVTFTDAGGRRVRVIADTLDISTSTSRAYTEHGSIAVTPVGGTEQAPAAIALGAQTWTPIGEGTFDLPVTIAGIAHGTVFSDTMIDLRMPDNSHWTLVLR